MVINKQFGDYLLLQRIAVGGQSEVFLAMKRGPQTYSRPVVIKALPSDRREDEKHIDLFYREAFISSRFNHPNVINVHDAKMIDGEHCMFMDFVSGQTVADIAQRGYKNGTPPTLKQIVQVVADGLAGLQYVHTFRDLDNQQYSVVHRDVSPQNLMVTYHGTTMLFDFGIARVIGLGHDEDTLAGGKYAYMSPEQLRGEQVGPVSDIFSMGVILYELATGYRLFRRSTPQEVIKAVTEDDIQPPRDLKPEIPQFLENCIMKALRRDPLARYKSADDMRSELQSFLEMTADSNLRRGLGTYVSALFKKERAEIASVLKDVPEFEEVERLESEHLTGDEGEFEAGDSTLELASRNEILEAIDERSDADHEATGRSSDALRNEVSRLRKQQVVLYAVIALIAVAALALMASQVMGADAKASTSTDVVEIE